MTPSGSHPRRVTRRRESVIEPTDRQSAALQIASRLRRQSHAASGEPSVAWIAAGVTVGAHQRPPEALTSVRDEVHHEEREIVGDVEFAQPRVELEAVDHPHRRVWQHVFGAQVAVNLACQTAPRAAVERLRMRDRERVREALKLEHPVDLGPLLDDRH